MGSTCVRREPHALSPKKQDYSGHKLSSITEDGSGIVPATDGCRVVLGTGSCPRSCLQIARLEIALARLGAHGRPASVILERPPSNNFFGPLRNPGLQSHFLAAGGI